MASKKEKKKQRRKGKATKVTEQRLDMKEEDWKITNLSPTQVVEAIRSGDKIITRAAAHKQTKNDATEIVYRRKLYEAGKLLLSVTLNSSVTKYIYLLYDTVHL